MVGDASFSDIGFAAWATPIPKQNSPAVSNGIMTDFMEFLLL
jgi:hypothetical protein